MKTIEAFQGFEELSMEETTVIMGGDVIAFTVGFVLGVIGQIIHTK